MAGHESLRYTLPKRAKPPVGRRPLVRRHAMEAGFPADRIERVKAVIDPATAE